MFCYLLFAQFFLCLFNFSHPAIFDITSYISKEGKHVIYFVPTSCTTCEKYSNILQAVENDVTIYRLKSADNHILPSYGAPALFFAKSNRFILYKGEVNEDVFMDWYRRMDHDGLIFLYDNNFEHDTQATTGGTTGNWLVIISRNLDQNKPIYEALALELKRRGTNVALIDSEMSPRTLKRFKVDKLPKIILLRHGKQYLYDFDVSSYDKLLGFATNFYTKAKSSKIPAETTGFDELVESIVNQIKKLEKKKGFALGIIVIFGLFICVFVVMCATWITCKQDKRNDRHSSKQKKLE